MGMVNRLSEPDVRAHLFDVEEFRERLCKGHMNEPVYMFNIQNKKPFFRGGWNYDIGYANNAPKMVFASGGYMTYSSLGAWPVCVATAEKDPLGVQWDEVTIFRYPTRGVFLKCICGDEWWEKCALWRVGLEQAYLALSSLHGGDSELCGEDE